MRRIIKRKDAAAMVGVSIKTIPLLIKENGFPKPVSVGKSNGWIDTEIQEWIEKKISERDAALAGGASLVGGAA
ncbi:helix-turn-helix transcriptional regulator [Candidatus Methylomicrobium oryzae]|uniref:helix-turn-helix transcriptional regulator n=1 Tax=Candidatus Methylomicrobium oryzae TaxID=2802053 RepID=UPI00192470C8|nr:AlpA family phage regulatory protein [Methylomicrobium sp. RS1]MBL1262061.1 AlpA family phage regulatory protein [Methylomicrobium sp. RS1]